MRVNPAVIVIALLAISESQATDVFVSKGKDGSVSFSDHVSATAEARQLSIKAYPTQGIQLNTHRVVQEAERPSKKRKPSTKKERAATDPISAGYDGDNAHDRALNQKEKCAAWRLKLLNSGQGLRDKVSQDEYDRVCVLGMHW